MAQRNWSITMISTITSTKICSACKEKRLLDYFYADKRASDGLCSQCSICMCKSTRKWQKEHPVNLKKSISKYRETNKGKQAKHRNALTYRQSIKGYLQEVFHHIKDRCNNPNTYNYNCYGGRGIQNKFTSLDDFRNYIISLGYDTYEKIKGLQIDRINNDGNYEPGNIRFVTCKENCNNKWRNK